MKKKYLLLLTGLVVVIIGFLVYSQYPNFKGAAPAITPPSENITQLIEEGTDKKGDPVSFPFTLPPGFAISIFANDLTNARVLKFDLDGHLLVSQPSQGKITALVDQDQDGKADQNLTVLSGLNRPHGLAFKDGYLYVAETDKVARFTYQNLTATNKQVLFTLPSGGNHFSRTIEFGSDGRLYTTVGSSCNVCTEKDAKRAKILVSDPDGQNLREFASGLRNTVFFVDHPKTGELWGTDMARDLLGDNIPPDEVNIIRNGQNYGWPNCYGQKINDATFHKTRADVCSFTAAPIFEIPAHSAPLGLAFVTGNLFPKDWQGDLIVAYHGSWNRSAPTGYKLVRLAVDGNRITGSQDFITGWLQGSSALGRPVDVVFDPNGHLFVSDDKAGVIYLVTAKPQ